MNFVKSKGIVAISSIETSEKKNREYVCYHCGNGGHIRSHCYKLMKDKRWRKIRFVQSNIATLSITSLRPQHVCNKIKGKNKTRRMIFHYCRKASHIGPYF
ncbi:hypothetical protein J1N35_038219 [Gossypium stocksii]|uniref:CCHC-type domain-containing protein n=1 Tax=Gossypium stocksii TaxID=47602 RepID=A0A9D3ZMP2_9ROSI|nr:hypothetical protein J1N35_038219 [Gossypium stocksii]